MKPRKLLKRPLRSAEELETLTAWVAERREQLLLRLKGGAVAAAVLVAVNLVTTTFRTGVEPAGRVFSLLVVLGVTLAWTPGMVRRMRTHPRLVAAQRQLLRHRGLVADEGPDLLGEEIERLAGRIRKRFAALGGDDSLLVDAERRAYVLLERLARNEEGATTGFRERLRIEQMRLRSRLEAFRVVLANMEVEALLTPDFYAGDGAREALLAAAALLEDGQSTAHGSREVLVPEVLTLTGTVTEPEGSGTSLLRPDFDAARTSIAVLPFADLSQEQDQEYFCHGLAEELINALTQIRDLRVIARASSFAFLGGRHDVREIGRTLGVETLVEGSVRKSGDRLRITVQLIRSDDGRHLWSQRYDRGAGDVFAIQDEITAALVARLREELGQEGLLRALSPPARPKRQVDLDAYHVYLKARHHWNRRTPPELHVSVELFQEAITRDSGFALAHAGLADAYALLGFYSVLAPNEAFPKAITAATQALEIDGDLAEAHAPLAFATLLYQWDWEGAERSFRQALRANPGYATAHHWYAEYLGLMGRHEESIDRARLARELDPLSPVVHTLVGWVHYYARHYDQAIAALERTLELETGFAPAEFWLALSHTAKGEPARGLEILPKSPSSPMMLAAAGRLEALRGDKQRAGEILGRLDEMSRDRYVSPYYCAGVHLACGDVADGFGCLERALEERDNWMVFLGVDPMWDDLREDPRFEDLLRKVGFE